MKGISAQGQAFTKMNIEKSDREYFTELYTKYRRPLDHYLKTFSSSPEQREELIQEVFIRIFRNLSSLDPEKSVKAYIYRSAGNTAKDWLRSRKRKESETTGLTGEPPAVNYRRPELELIRNEDEDLIRNALGELKPADRRLVLLHYYEGMKIREIADVTGSPAGTVKYRLYRIRSRLAVRLKRCMGEEV